MFNTAKHFTQGVAVSHCSASIRATFLLAESPSALLHPLPWQALDAVLLGAGAKPCFSWNGIADVQASRLRCCVSAWRFCFLNMKV